MQAKNNYWVNPSFQFANLLLIRFALHVQIPVLSLNIISVSASKWWVGTKILNLMCVPWLLILLLREIISILYFSLGLSSKENTKSLANFSELKILQTWLCTLSHAIISDHAVDKTTQRASGTADLICSKVQVLHLCPCIWCSIMARLKSTYFCNLWWQCI